MHAPVGVVISVSDAVPVILIQLSLKISKIAGPGFDTLPCENVILPPSLAITELNDLVFTLEQYQLMRARVCVGGDTLVAKKMSRGLVSLVQKGILFKDEQIYSIHYRLVPYMRLRAKCDYSTAIREVGQN